MNGTVSSNSETNSRAARRDYSCIGFGLLIMLAVSLGGSYLLSKYFGSTVTGSYSLRLLSSSGIMYFIAMPLAALVMVIGRKKGESTVPVKGGRNPGGFFLALFAAITLMIVGSYAGTAVNTILESTTGHSSASGLTQFTSLGEAAVYFAVAVVIAPVAEELFFRRLVTGTLSRWGAKTAAVVSALFFGLAHGNLEQFFYAFLIGILLAYVYLKTGRIGTTILLHMTINLVGGFLPLLAYGIYMPEGALENFYAVYEEMLTAQTVEAIESLSGEVMSLLGQLLPGLMLASSVSSFTQLCGWAGAVILLLTRRHLNWKKGEKDIPKSDVGATVFCAPGVLLFIAGAVAYMVYAAIIAG